MSRSRVECRGVITPPRSHRSLHDSLPSSALIVQPTVEFPPHNEQAAVADELQSVSANASSGIDTPPTPAAPSLQSHYGLSSLLRATPPLCPYIIGKAAFQ